MSESRDMELVDIVCNSCGESSSAWCAVVYDSRETDENGDFKLVPWYWYGTAAANFRWGGRYPLCHECRKAYVTMCSVDGMVNG